MPAMAIVLAASAVVPALLCMWYFWARDIYPEPGRVVWTTFGLGVVILAPVAGTETCLRFDENPWAQLYALPDPTRPSFHMLRNLLGGKADRYPQRNQLRPGAANHAHEILERPRQQYN